MATYNKGILGAFSGKIGPVVGVNRNGFSYMRSLAMIKTNQQFSEEQDIQLYPVDQKGTINSSISILHYSGFFGHRYK
jgi:hypothetical protein